MANPFEDPFPEEETDSKPEKKGSDLNTTESKVVVTLKGGSGFEAPWIVIHGQDTGDAKEILQEVFESGLHEDVAKAAQAFNVGGRGSTGRGSRSNSASSLGTKRCDHGEMAYREGEKSGKKWKAYFCPAENRDEQCSPIWVK